MLGDKILLTAIFVLTSLFVCGQSFVDSTLYPPQSEFLSPASSLNFDSRELIAKTDSLRFRFLPWTDERTNDFIFLEGSLSLTDMKMADGHLSMIPTTPDYAAIDVHYLKTWTAPDSVKTLSTLLFESKDSIHWISIFGNHLSDHDVLCLTVDEDDFFSDSLGIMVPGVAYVNKERSGNYHLRGRQSERGAYLHYFNRDSLLFSMPIKVRIHGSMQRGAGQKSLRMYFPDGNKKNDFFPESSRKSFDQVILRNGNSAGNGTHITDSFVHNCTPGDYLIANPSRPTELFINGEYWGFYHVRHRNNASNVVAIKEWGEALEIYDEKVLTEATFNTPIDSLSEQIVNFNLSTPEDWAKLEQVLDVENARDYILANTFFSNQDWIINNVKMYRNPQTRKWCFLLDDMDACMNGEADVNIFHNIEMAKGCYAEILKGLLSCPQFVDSLWTRYNELKRGVWSTLNLKLELARWQANHARVIESHRLRWKQSFVHKDLAASNASAQNFLSHRHYFFEEQLSAYGEVSASSQQGYWIITLLIALFLGVLSILARIPIFFRNASMLLAQWMLMFSVVSICCPQGINLSLFVSPESCLTPSTWMMDVMSTLGLQIGSNGFIAAIALIFAMCALALAAMLKELSASRFEVCFVGFLTPLYFVLLPSADWLLVILSSLMIISYHRGSRLGISIVLLFSAFLVPAVLLIMPAIFLAEMLTSSSRKLGLTNFFMCAIASTVGASLASLTWFSGFQNLGSAFNLEMSLTKLPLLSGVKDATILLDASSIALAMLGLFLVVNFCLQKANRGLQASRELALSAGVLSTIVIFALVSQEWHLVKRFVLSSGFVIVLIMNYRRQANSRIAYFWPLYFAIVFLIFGSYSHILIQIKFTLVALFLGSFFLVYHENNTIRNGFRIIQICGMAFAQWYFLMHWCSLGPIQ